MLLPNFGNISDRGMFFMQGKLPKMAILSKWEISPDFHFFTYFHEYFSKILMFVIKLHLKTLKLDDIMGNKY
jgi:hypothetical protein